MIKVEKFNNFYFFCLALSDDDYDSHYSSLLFILILLLQFYIIYSVSHLVSKKLKNRQKRELDKYSELDRKRK